jgi:hypothetical protein
MIPVLRSCSPLFRPGCEGLRTKRYEGRTPGAEVWQGSSPQVSASSGEFCPVSLISSSADFPPGPPTGQPRAAQEDTDTGWTVDLLERTSGQAFNPIALHPAFSSLPPAARVARATEAMLCCTGAVSNADLQAHLEYTPNGLL